MPRSRGRLARCRVGLEWFVSLVSVGELQQLVSAHGYWVVALIVGLESMGLPLPGETILVLAAIYAAPEPTFNFCVLMPVPASSPVAGSTTPSLLRLTHVSPT